MSEFRLTQISDTHLARSNKFADLTDNFHRVGEHIDATRPDLVVNTGDVAWDGPSNRADLGIRGGIARGVTGGMPLPSRQSRRRRQSDRGRRRAPAHGERKGCAVFAEIFGEDRWQFEAAGWRFIGLNSLIMNTGISNEIEQEEWLAITTLRRQRQADRTVPA